LKKLKYIFLKGKKPAAGAETEQLAPVKATIFVAKTFPMWQQIILNSLSAIYLVRIHKIYKTSKKA
jgi:hypothetical protein